MMKSEIERLREEAELHAVVDTPVRKQWRIPAGNSGNPVTITLDIPEVRVTDAAGREIVIAPDQAELLGSRLSDINGWLQQGDSEWLEPDE